MNDEAIDKKTAALLKADEAYRVFVRQHDRHCITIDAGFPGKGDDPAQVIDDAIQRGLNVLTGRNLRYMRLVTVTTTVINVSYGEMVLVTVIAEPLPPRRSPHER